MAINEAVDWSRDLGGGVRVALVQAGTFRSDAGTLFGPVPRDDAAFVALARDIDTPADLALARSLLQGAAGVI